MKNLAIMLFLTVIITALSACGTCRTCFTVVDTPNYHTETYNGYRHHWTKGVLVDNRTGRVKSRVWKYDGYTDLLSAEERAERNGKKSVKDDDWSDPIYYGKNKKIKS